MCTVLLLSGMTSIALAQSAPIKGANANPDTSVNALTLYRNGNRGNDTNSVNANGFSIQEAELQFFSDVDPYSRLTALFSISQTNGNWGISPEELFAETLEVPAVIIKGGKFKAAFGKHNTLHTHAFPFIDAPLIQSVLLGDEGLNDVGLSAAALVPLPWFSEFTVQILSGRTEGTDYINSHNASDNVFLAHYRNLWDLSEDLTAEFGLSGATGKNDFALTNGNLQSGNTYLYNADLNFKWRPVEGGKYHALIWSTEYTNRQVSRPSSSNVGQGYASWLQYQFAERWWAQVRSEYLRVLDTDKIAPLQIQPYQRKYSALLGFFPSEFSGFRLQYDNLNDGQDTNEQRISLQGNFTIGAHPAHAY